MVSITEVLSGSVTVTKNESGLTDMEGGSVIVNGPSLTSKKSDA
jgi:hypothetical protein